MGSVDVIVVNYHTMDDLEAFIMSYGYSQVDTTLTVATVEAQPEEIDQTNILLDRVDGPTQQYVNFSNIGYSGACNNTARLGNSEVIAFFNADTQLYEDTIDKCYELLMSDPTYAVTGPMQINSKGLITHAGIMGTNKEPDLRGWQKPDLQNFRDVQEAVSVSGSAYFVKRSVWEEMTVCPVFQAEFPECAGAFLPTQLFYEETGFSYHVRAHGYKVMYAGNSLMHHEWHRSVKKHGGDRHIKESRKVFRRFCAAHNIECD